MDIWETASGLKKSFNRMEHSKNARRSASFSTLNTPTLKSASTSFQIVEFDAGVIRWTNRTDHWKLSPLLWPSEPRSGWSS